MATRNITEDIKKHSGWSIFMGILTVILGGFLIAYPLATATLTSLLFGCVLILVAAAEFVFAFYSQSFGNFFLKVLLGVLYGVAGLVLAFFPLTGVAALTVLLGLLLLVYAGAVAVLAFRLRPIEGWGWFLFDGIVSLLLGILVLARWPSSSVWALGTLVGLAVITGGIARIMIAAKIRKGAGMVPGDTRRAA